MVPEKKPFQSRFLPNHSTAAANAAVKKEESETSSEEETTSDESEEEEEEVKPTPAPSTAASRASLARESYADTNRRNSRDETNVRGGYSSPTYGRSFDHDTSSRYGTSSGVRSRPNAYEPEDTSSRYGSGSSG